MREVIYDTETTGKRYQDGHRVVEIGAIELIDGVITGRQFHKIINPERHIPDDVIAIHGITNEQVANAPRFKDILPEFLEFFRGAKVIAHNGDFDERFLDNELKLADHSESFWTIVAEAADTIPMSRKIWFGTQYKHNLNVVLDRCNIDRSERSLHGGLIDSQLLAKAYLHMKKLIIEMGPTLEDDVPRGPIQRIHLKKPLCPVIVNDESLALHEKAVNNSRSTLSPKP